MLSVATASSKSARQASPKRRWWPSCRKLTRMFPGFTSSRMRPRESQRKYIQPQPTLLAFCNKEANLYVCIQSNAVHGVQGLQHTGTNVLGLSWGETLFLCNLSDMTVVVFRDNRGLLIGFGLLLIFVNDGSEKGVGTVLSWKRCKRVRSVSTRYTRSLLMMTVPTCRVAERTTVINNTVHQELGPNIHCQPYCWI